MLLSAVSVLTVAQSSSEIPEGLMNNHVFVTQCLFTSSTMAVPYLHYSAALRVTGLDNLPLRSSTATII